MTRKFLEELGLEKEMIDKILDENSRDIGKAKGNYDDIKTELDLLKTEITNRDTQLADLKKLDPEGLKAQIDALQAANEKAKAEYEAALDHTIINGEIERDLLKAGAKNIKAVMALLDLAKVKRDGESVTGHQDQIKALVEAEDSKFLFNIEEKFKFKGAKPGEGGAGSTGSGGIVNPWSKDHWNLTEQGRIIKEDPELAKTLKNG